MAKAVLENNSMHQTQSKISRNPRVDNRRWFLGQQQKVWEF